MQRPIGIICGNSAHPAEDQTKEIFTAIGSEIPIEDVKFLISPQIIAKLRLLYHRGYREIIVQSPARLSRELFKLQKILFSIFEIGLKLYVARDGRLIEVEMKHTTTTVGLPMVGVSVNGLNLLEDVVISEPPIE